MVHADVPINDIEPLARVVALQLVPANAHYLDALTQLTAFAARDSSSTGELADYVSRIESYKGRPLSQMRGHFDGFLAAEVPFLPGTYLVLQGLMTDAGIVVRHLLPAIFGPFRDQFPDTFTRNVEACARLLLMTSDHLGARMRVGRYTTAPPKPTTVVVPDHGELTTLADALTLNEPEFFGGLPGALTAYLQDMLFADADTLPRWDGSDIDQALIARPFVRTGRNTVVIATPFELMVTLRHAICVEAKAHDCHALLHEAITAHAARLTRQLCESLFDGEHATRGDVGFSEFRGTFDADKELDIRVSVPSLDTETDSVLVDPLTVAAPPAEPSDDGRRKLTIDVFWPLGRDLYLLTPNEQAHLCSTFEDLETILYTSGTDQLSLWYFAEALDRLHNNDTTILHGGLADLYGLYDGNDQSFYMGDDSPSPTALVVESDYSEALRIKIAERLGRTFVRIANRLHECFLAHGDATPVREVIALPRIIFCAEVPGLTIWVELRTSSLENQVRLRSFAEAMCYWLVCIHDRAPELFADFEPELQILLIEAEWPNDDDDRWIRRGPDVDGKNLTFEFKAPPKPDSDAPPNTLDRALIREVLSTLSTIDDAAANPAFADQAIEILAPPGERRMLHLVQSDVDLIAWPGDLPKARTTVAAVTSRLLDELGLHLRQDFGRNVGNIPSSERTQVLNDEVVAYFRDRLTTALAAYDGISLLDYLIRANEALLHEGYVQWQRHPSRLACFGPASDETQRLAQRIREATSASVSSRFLIELAAATQPTSVAAPTIEAYDALLGLASEIVHKGFLSDAIHADLSHAELSILPSGRLGIRRDDDRYTQGLQSLLSANAAATVDDAARRNAWDPGVTDTATGDLPAADSVAIVEWGFSFTELALFTSELVNLSTEREQEDVGLVAVQDIRQRMTSKFAWSEDKVSAFLDHLTMAVEDDFWALGGEVFPWRYNRGRSYLRRPLIRCSLDGVDHVIFGHRNTRRTSFEWHGQYNSGRLKAKTAEMRAALGAARDLNGDRFEQRVADELLEWCEPVRRRVRRLGVHDLRNINGRDLGDIDLLAFHPSSRSLYVLEAKSLAVARTPREMANELSSLIEGRTSAVERLRGRYEWVCAHLPDVLPTLGVGEGPVRVRPLIIVDADLLTARFNSRYRIVPFARLADVFT
ncbi:hypothetical protein [Mycolicibacterium iranicum]|uniref:Uncharacterized protein n=1 Tax=Mycolicibacterium iranicum TaxID=912594 RepID=A0A178LTP2_MYCIR|nr:hypothetical protein [Mycolicibacterium iranicum]OAN36793.1 hypothetical protein A4X20_06250 [Mycolicibacterium iranicum]